MIRACAVCATFEITGSAWIGGRMIAVCYLCEHTAKVHPRGGTCLHTAADIYPTHVRRALDAAIDLARLEPVEVIEPNTDRVDHIVRRNRVPQKQLAGLKPRGNPLCTW